MFDVLDVPDPIIMNVLIEQFNVETTLLIERREEASRVMNHVRPQGASSTYTLDGDQVLDGRHYSNKSGRMGIIRASVNDAIGYVAITVYNILQNWLGGGGKQDYFHGLPLAPLKEPCPTICTSPPTQA